MIERGLGGGLTGQGAFGAMASAYLQSNGIDPSVLSDPNPKNIATTALTAYLTSLGVPPQLSGPLAGAAVDTITSGELPKVDVKSLFNGDAIKGQLLDAAKGYLSGMGIDPAVADNMMNDIVLSKKALDDAKDSLGKTVGDALIRAKEAITDKIKGLFKVEEVPVIPKDVKIAGKDASSESPDLKGIGKSPESYQRVNEAVDIDRFLKDQVKGFLPPMNWWDKMPDWPAISYTAIIMDQTRAAKKKVLEDIDPPEETEFEIESHKFPYKNMAVSVLQKGKVDNGTTTVILGHELLQLAEDKDTVQDTDPIVGNVPLGIVTNTTQTNTKYFPIPPVIPFPEVYRDDLTDQKNPALDLFDTQKLVDEFLAIGQRIYDQQTENPTIFGFDNVNSKYEKDKNIVLANYKQYKVNIRKMEHINNIVEKNSNNYLIEKITTRHDIPNCSTAEEFTTRYLREKLLAWYNETADPETKTWKDYHWLPGEPGYIEMLLTVGDYEWYDNIIAGLEDSVARLEDLESTLDLLASMANALGTIDKYSTALEIAEKIVETPDWDWKNTVTFTNEVIDQTMLKELLGVSEIIGDVGGEITAIRSELDGLRQSNQALLEEVRIMSPTFMSYPIIWTKLQELCAQVNSDIDSYLNTLILNKRGDNETVGWHSSPSHLMLDISEQLAKICETVMADVQNIIDQQAALPQLGKHRLDSMLNKINEIRLHGPLCAIPWHYWMAIDNVNAAERLYNDIWSDVFDCWEREYIIRNWRILYEHHLAGVLPAILYGKPLFSAECPHHLPLLEAPVPVDYRDIDINYLSANCRKNFNFLTSWLTSALYAIGVKRVALGAVITDTSLNGNDENEPWLDMLNELNAKNLIIKEEIENAIKSYNGTSELLQKAEMDKIIAAKELSPTHYSNQTLMNMSSELHLLDTFPVTVLDVASNENRTGTAVDNSPAQEWKVVSIPEDLPAEEAEAVKTATIEGEAAQKKMEEKRMEIDRLTVLKKSGKATPEQLEELDNAEYELKLMQDPNSEESKAIEKMESALAPFTTVETVKVKTIPTVGGPAEEVVDTGVSADDDSSTESAYVGDVQEFMPWKYMQPNWDTQRELVEPPVVVPPETAPVIPEPPVVEMPDVAEHPDNPVEDIKIVPNVIESVIREFTNEKVEPLKMASDQLSKLGLDLSDPDLQNLAKMALTEYLVSQGIPRMLAKEMADKAVDTAAKEAGSRSAPDRIISGGLMPDSETDDPMVKTKAGMVDSLLAVVSEAVEREEGFNQEKHT